MDRQFVQRLIRRLYSMLTWLYPPQFRAKFAEEQRAVFALAQGEDGGSGSVLLLRELAQLPGVLLRLHWAALRSGGWKNLFGAVALIGIFVPPLLEGVSRTLPSHPWVHNLLMILLLAGMLAVALLGLPRWGLPYAGFVLAVISFYSAFLIFSPVMLLLPRRDYSALPLIPRLAFGGMWTGAQMTLILAIILLLPGLRRLVVGATGERFPKLWRHARRPTDLSFMLYGAAIFYVYMAFDEYTLNFWFSLAAVACLLIGAWVYLQVNTQRKGMAALLAALTLAFVVVAVGKYQLVPLQTTWNGWFDGHPLGVERWFEALTEVVNLFWLWVALLVPQVWRRPFASPPPPNHAAGG